VTRELYQRDLNPRAWVEYDHVVHLLRTVKKVLQSQDPLVLQTLGSHNGEANIRLTQRVIMKLASVELVLQGAARLWWYRVRDGGSLRVIPQDHNHVRLLLMEFPDPQPEWLEYLVGWFRRTIELSGGNQVTVELTRMASVPYDVSEYTCRWQ
jgi:hypothetical protein